MILLLESAEKRWWILIVTVRCLGLDWAGFVRQLFFSGQQGQFVFIRDDRSSEDYFGVCEVQVFMFKGIQEALKF